MTQVAIDLWAFWGKYRGVTPDGRPDYHAAVAHMFDVGAVAEVMVMDRAEWFAALLGCSPELARRWVPFLIGAHDVGKLQPGFEQKVDAPGILAALTASGLPLIPDGQRQAMTTGFDHGLQSVVALTRWLTPRLAGAAGAPADLAKALAMAVGAHHGRYHSSLRVRDHLARHGRYDRGGWADVQDRALDWLAGELIGRDPVLAAGPPNVSALVLALSGLTSICDWIGSSKVDFPLTGVLVRPEDYPGHSRPLALAAVSRRGFLEPERLRAIGEPGGTGWTVASFSRLFPRTPSPRPVQEAVMGLACLRGRGPALLVVEAPMGEGKTEAAFWWAAASQSDTCRGLYMALPTQATSNAMYRRFLTVLRAADPGGPLPDVRLVHGASALTEGTGEGRLTPNTPASDDRRAALDALSWFAPRKRALWATYAVGTVDQALTAALAVKHGFVRLAGLASKVVIVDEVHAYDVYMSAILERLLRWLAELGTPVVLLSATLPAARRASLVAAYTGRAGDGASTVPTAYPLVGRVDREGRTDWVEPGPSGRASTVAIDRWPDPGDHPAGLARVAEAVRGQVHEGGCVAWVHNTVDSAQAAYRALRRLEAERPGPPTELRLFHARYRLIDRQRTESELIARFGPGGDRPFRSIVLATQVVEQSLDVDFDLLVTSPAPIDLFLQRLGRLHRFSGTPRPRSLSRPRVILLTPPRDGARPRFGPTQWVYERFVLLKTLLALGDRTELRLPDDIRDLVEAVYDDCVPGADLTDPASLDVEDFRETWDALEAKRDGERAEANTRLLPAPDLPDPFYDGMGVEFEEADEDAQADRWVAAVTRLGRPRRNVILLHSHDGGLYLDPEGGLPLDLARPPNRALVRELMLRAISVSKPELVGYQPELDPAPGLRDCAALRFHTTLVLEQGRLRLPGRGLVVRLDPELGLVYERT